MNNSEDYCRGYSAGYRDGAAMKARMNGIKRQKRVKCDCHKHTNQVCDICQNTVGKIIKDKK